MSKDKTIAVFRDKNGHVEIHEKFEGTPTKGTHRIAHTTKWKAEAPPPPPPPSLIETTKNVDESPKQEPAHFSTDRLPSKMIDTADETSETIDRSDDTCVSPVTAGLQKKVALPMHDELRKRLLATKPKAISEKDFLEFIKIVDELISDDDEDDDDVGQEDEDEDNDGGVDQTLIDKEEVNRNAIDEPSATEENENSETVGGEPLAVPAIPPRAHGDAGGPKFSRHVHFSEHNDFRVIDDDAVASLPASPSSNAVPPENAISPQAELALSSSSSLPSTTASNSPKPILRNKSEVSPVNEPWMRKIQKREEPKKREFISQTLFSDKVVERNLDDAPSLHPVPSTAAMSADPSPSAGTTKSTGQKPVSKFKKMRQAKQLRK